MGPDRSTGGDYDFFGGSANPPQAAPPATPAAAPGPQDNRFGTPAPVADNRFGTPPAQYGTPAGQFGVPTGGFGAPVGHAAPAAPAARQRSGLPTWALALIALAAIAVVGVVAAVVVPSVMGSDVEKAWKKTTVSMPASMSGYSRQDNAQSKQVIDLMRKSFKDEQLSGWQAGVYSGGDETVVAMAAKYNEPQSGADSTQAQRDFVAGFQDGLGDIGSVATVMPGKLGGQMACTRVMGERQFTACGATDMAAVVILISDDPNFSTSTAVAMREAIEKR